MKVAGSDMALGEHGCLRRVWTQAQVAANDDRYLEGRKIGQLSSLHLPVSGVGLAEQE